MNLVIRLLLVFVFVVFLFLALEYVGELLFFYEELSPDMFFLYRFFSGLVGVFLLMSIASVAGFSARYGLFCFVLYSVYFMSSSALFVYGDASLIYKIFYWFSLPLGGAAGWVIWVYVNYLKKYLKINQG